MVSYRPEQNQEKRLSARGPKEPTPDSTTRKLVDPSGTFLLQVVGTRLIQPAVISATFGAQCMNLYFKRPWKQENNQPVANFPGISL